MSQTLQETFSRLWTLDRDVLAIARLSLRVSVTAVGIGLVLGIPLGALIAVARFPGRGAVVGLLNTFMGLPPVIVGLILYLALSRSGPFGAFGLLFTPAAMVAAQAVLATPLVAALTRQVIADAEAHLGEQLRSLHLSAPQRAGVLIYDARFSLVTAALAAFGRAISEIGAVLVVGGNIDGHTRTMTTAISLETQKGDLSLALALGLVLMSLVLAVNAAAALLRSHVARAYG
ncbi:putative Sulfate/tungstate uptake transporter, membrane component of ABC transporter [Methylorubrum extorquens]|uniref:Putative Sulfate/tungstate uptake transporter, membrane component of ABC transporter n=1 Tax=Methylorubrum extorquens TaxID=408 RepID=A0A2N9AQ96_METEX|nr:ABC transporter permease [Methylorubrum zatmanii]ARO56513.1 ABC transporter permease [Methylorubrum zatmanii]KQP98805.1 ABC transporter permease [Methylobacterium sp. Leaf121]SOR29535.1 putative Sulfate/tungstate uptake transporter, membrane component of ABC transporter [Methylorubrum extorquens]